MPKTSMPKDSMPKNLLVVGAGAGFARATARRFGSDRWVVHLVARSQEGLERLSSELAGKGVVKGSR